MDPRKLKEGFIRVESRWILLDSTGMYVKILSDFFHTAVQNLGKPVPKGRAMVVVIAGGGNSYALVPILNPNSVPHGFA